MAPKAYVFFDVDDTLVQWTANWGQVFAQAAQQVGAAVSVDQASQALESALSSFYDDYLRKHAALGDERAFWLDYDGRIFQMLGVRPIQRARCAAARVAELLKRPDCLRLFPEVPEVLRALDDRGVRLGIITGRPRAAPDLEALGVLHYFEPVLDGLSVGEGKQAGGRLFALAAEAVRATRTAGWHVGDSYKYDVHAARAAGLRPVLVDRRGLFPGADCPRLTDLSGLPDLIAEMLKEAAP